MKVTFNRNEIYTALVAYAKSLGYSVVIDGELTATMDQELYRKNDPCSITLAITIGSAPDKKGDQ